MSGTLRQVGKAGTPSYLNGTEVISKHNQYRVTVNTNKYIYRVLKVENLREEFYSGKVYCVTVEPYHTIMVRRGGNTMWCGQTLDETGYFALAKLGIGESVYISTPDRNTDPE
jgi:hypothetical protein